MSHRITRIGIASECAMSAMTRVLKRTQRNVLHKENRAMVYGQGNGRPRSRATIPAMGLPKLNVQERATTPHTYIHHGTCIH